MVQAPFLADVKRSQRSAFTIVGSAKEEEERLLRRKQEEEKRFQETQLNSHPLLGLSMIGEQWADPISQKSKYFRFYSFFVQKYMLPIEFL